MKWSVLHSVPCCHRKGEGLFGEPWPIACYWCSFNI